MKADIRRYLSRIGRKGGQSTSEAKITAVLSNLEAAHEAKRKYPPCKQYKNKSHRFNPTTGKCYGCGYQKPGTKSKKAK